MAIWKTYRIADIIAEISEEKFVLPVIQRPLVWTEEKMELLFDTLLKRIPNLYLTIAHLQKMVI